MPRCLKGPAGLTPIIPEGRGLASVKRRGVWRGRSLPLGRRAEMCTSRSRGSWVAWIGLGRAATLHEWGMRVVGVGHGDRADDLY